MAVAAPGADNPPAWQVFVVTFVSYLLAARLALLLAAPRWSSAMLTEPLNVQAFLELLDGLLDKVDTRFG